MTATIFLDLIGISWYLICGFLTTFICAHQVRKENPGHCAMLLLCLLTISCPYMFELNSILRPLAPDGIHWIDLPTLPADRLKALLAAPLEACFHSIAFALWIAPAHYGLVMAFCKVVALHRQ